LIGFNKILAEYWRGSACSGYRALIDADLFFGFALDNLSVFLLSDVGCVKMEAIGITRGAG